MPRRRRLTSSPYSLARASNNVRAMTRGPTAYATRRVRRKVYSKEFGLTRSILKAFGLSK